ncbi:MAG TPA: enoyl-CoA hydratase/isomerase family protein [Kofleriaceae bacterium]|nr:enoyl-CoA hydratase/isomerase family protein [Kofleriaceae bacterium]
MYSTIRVDERGPVARITLDRPDKRNPIGPATCGELVAAFGALKAAADVHVVILTGAGTVFSAGGDLSAMQQQTGPTATLVELFTTMHELGKPIIAMVNGHALAGGLGLMVACDLVIASDQAQFGTTEIAVGLWPMMITAEITRSVGRKKTLEMMLTGRKLNAAEALDAGLINRAVPPDQLETVTMQLATEIAERSPAALKLGLHAFYRSQDMELETQLRYLQAELGRVLALEDAAEGITAFLQKRKPVWKGK